MIKLDKTLSVGTLIHLAALVLTIVVLYSGVIGKLSAIETKVDAMWRWFIR